jgi:hypothetical protein
MGWSVGCAWGGRVKEGSEEGKGRTHQKESIRRDGIQERDPPNASTPRHQADDQRQDDPDKLVAAIHAHLETPSDASGRRAADVEEVGPELDGDELEKDDAEGFGGCSAEDFGVELGGEAGVEGGEEDIGYEGHCWWGKGEEGCV